MNRLHILNEKLQSGIGKIEPEYQTLSDKYVDRHHSFDGAMHRRSFYFSVPFYF